MVRVIIALCVGVVLFAILNLVPFMHNSPFALGSFAVAWTHIGALVGGYMTYKRTK